jgi:hypothetical protein
MDITISAGNYTFDEGECRDWEESSGEVDLSGFWRALAPDRHQLSAISGTGRQAIDLRRADLSGFWRALAPDRHQLSAISGTGRQSEET